MLRFIYLFGLLLGMLTACDKMPENGELDGMWHLQEMTDLTEEAAEPQDVRAKQFYWSFQLNLLQIYSVTDVLYRNELTGEYTYRAYCRFSKTGTSLNVSEVYVHFDSRDSLLTDPATPLMHRYGIMGNADNFSIEQLNSKRMILVSDERRLVFRKF